MKPEETCQAIVRGADSGAAANKPKRDPDIEAELLRDVFVNYSRQHDFKPGTVVREKAGCSLLRKSGNGRFVLELRDDEPLLDIET